jgi:hypothetical protein
MMEARARVNPLAAGHASPPPSSDPQIAFLSIFDLGNLLGRFLGGFEFFEKKSFL